MLYSALNLWLNMNTSLVFLADDVIIGEKPAISFLLDVYKKYKFSVVALEEVTWDEVSRYGIVQVKEIEQVRL